MKLLYVLRNGLHKANGKFLIGEAFLLRPKSPSYQILLVFSIWERLMLVNRSSLKIPLCAFMVFTYLP